MTPGLAWGLGHSQSMVMIVGSALNVGRSELVLDIDLRLFLRDWLGGADPATESFPYDLGGLRLWQERRIAKGRNRHIHRKAREVKGLTLRSKVPLPEVQRGLNSACLKPTDRLSLQRFHSKYRPKPRKRLRCVIGKACNQEEGLAEMAGAGDERGDLEFQSCYPEANTSVTYHVGASSPCHGVESHGTVQRRTGRFGHIFATASSPVTV